MKFAEKLKMIRENAGLSQDELARILGISRSHLNELENDRTEPRPVLINCMSLMFEIDKEWLLNDESGDIKPINKTVSLISLIDAGYEKLGDSYKKFVEKQIKELLKLQEENEKNQD